MFEVVLTIRNTQTGKVPYEGTAEMSELLMQQTHAAVEQKLDQYSWRVPNPDHDPEQPDDPETNPREMLHTGHDALGYFIRRITEQAVIEYTDWLADRAKEQSRADTRQAIANGLTVSVMKEE